MIRNIIALTFTDFLQDIKKLLQMMVEKIKSECGRYAISALDISAKIQKSLPGVKTKKKPAIRCDCLLSSRRAVGHLPLSRAADGAPCSLRGKHGLVVLVQHVLVPVEVGEIPFYSRMRQIPCESCWKARCLSWTGSAGSLSAGLSSPVGSRRPGRGAGRASGSRERKARRASRAEALWSEGGGLV